MSTLIAFLVLALSPLAAAAESPLEVSGFVDAQLQFTSSESLTRGFLVNDGALYFTRELGGPDFKVDLPFRMITQGNPNFEFATIKAQAYAGYKHANGLRWKLGQFDTTFGFEGNDTVDVPFTRQGSLYNFTDPFVHAGALLGYDVSSELGLNLYVASPNDTGSLSGGKNPQFGAQVVRTGSIRGTLGGLVSKDGPTGDTYYYVDATVGTTLGRLSVDAEVNYAKHPSDVKPDGTALPAGVGVLVQPIYAFTDETSFGIRAEYVTHFGKRDPRVTAAQPYLERQILIFAGPQCQLARSLRLKLDYSYQDNQAFGGAQETVHGVQFAAVQRF